jgi:hypothetical protein
VKAYFYQRKEKGGKAKEWSYRLRNIPRDLPKAAWPDKFKKNGTLWTSKARTVEHVNKRIQEVLNTAHDIKMGRRPADLGDIRKAKRAYMDWGMVQGGTRNEMGWAPEHARHISRYLDIWIDTLDLKTPTDLMEAQPAFRRALVKMLTAGDAPNTVNHRAQTLTGFCRWMKEERLLPTIPLYHKTLDRTPRRARGKFRVDEVGRLIAVAPERRAIIYHLAFVTGYRKTSISKIRAGYFDWSILTIGLNYLTVKNRRKTVKPLPPKLAELLFPLVQGKGPKDFVFDWFKPSQAVKGLRRDMAKAGIPLTDDQGRVRDFHSIKGSYGSALDDLGTEPKVMQQGLDHATFAQTLAYLKRELEPLRVAAAAAEAGLFTSAKPSGKPYHTGDTEENDNLERAGTPMGYNQKLQVPHPPPIVSQSPANPRQSPAKGNPGRIATFPDLPQSSLEEAQRIVARLYHRISDPDFLRALDLLAKATPQQAAQVADLLKANARKAAG